MANEIKTNSQLQLWFEAGLDEDGEVIIQRKNFNLIKSEADAVSLYAVATALAELQAHPLNQVIRNNTYHIQPE